MAQTQQSTPISSTDYARQLNNPNTKIGQEFLNAQIASLQMKIALDDYTQRVIAFCVRQDTREREAFALKQAAIAQKEEEYRYYLDSLPKGTTLETASGIKTIEEFKQNLQRLDNQYAQLTADQNKLYEEWESDRKERALGSLKDFKEGLKAAGLVLTTPDGRPIDLTDAKLAQLAEAYSRIPKRIFEINPSLHDLINQQPTFEGKLEIIKTMMQKANFGGSVESAKRTGGDEQAPLLEGNDVITQQKKIDDFNQKKEMILNNDQAFYSALSDQWMKEYQATESGKAGIQDMLLFMRQQGKLQASVHPKAMQDSNEKSKIADQLVRQIRMKYKNVLTGTDQEKEALRQSVLSVLDRKHSSASLGSGYVEADAFRMIKEGEISLKKVETVEEKNKMLDVVAAEMQKHRPGQQI